MDGVVYLDNQSTTRIDDRVLSAMLPYYTDIYGNPSNANNIFGSRARRAVDEAAGAIAKIIGAESANEIIFTSGATESNDLAINGVVSNRGVENPHIITSKIEHPSVINPCRELVGRGAEVTFAGVDGDGVVDAGEIESSVGENTALISIMAANNEIGSIQPISRIAKIAESRGITFHTDATQYIASSRLDVTAMGADLVSLSAHKIYGPKGIGLLYKRQPTRLTPRIVGGKQQRGLRGGTLNTPAIVGFAEALKILEAEREAENRRISRLKAELLSRLNSGLSISVNGSAENGISGNLSVAFHDFTARHVMSMVPEMAVSMGSSCSSVESAGSHVLDAIGLPRELQKNTIRFSLGRQTTAEEIERVASLITSRLGGR